MDIALIILLVFGFFILLSSFFTVKQQTAVVLSVLENLQVLEIRFALKNSIN
jgi:regulator of protease activity HflC (stomatin/prohibitin superfamily)